MYQRSSILGRQLASPSAAYGHALVRRMEKPRRPWWFGQTLRSSQPIASEPTAPGPYPRDEAMARVEAVLFLAREPLSSRKIAQLAGVADGTAARTLVRKLNRIYDQSGSAFRVEEVAGGFQMLTRPKFGPWLRRLFRSPVETHLSSPALETLAVVAYRQPVVRAEVEAIRGVQCGEILRQLMERDLVRIAGRSEDLGRPFLYGTTKRFLQVFGLRHLDELPRAELLRGSGAESPGPESNPENPGTDQASDRNQRTSAFASGANQTNQITESVIVEEEESAVSVTTYAPFDTDENLDRDEAAWTSAGTGVASPVAGPRAEDEDDDEDWEDEDDEDLEDDEEVEEEEEDLEEEEWEEVDDEEEEEDEDWEDDDEDWDDDEDEDEDWEDEDE